MSLLIIGISDWDGSAFGPVHGSWVPEPPHPFVSCGTRIWWVGVVQGMNMKQKNLYCRLYNSTLDNPFQIIVVVLWLF